MKGLKFVVVELDNTLSYEKYLEAGFNPEALIQTEVFGAWKLILGPGSAMRVSVLDPFISARTDKRRLLRHLRLGAYDSRKPARVAGPPKQRT